MPPTKPKWVRAYVMLPPGARAEIGFAFRLTSGLESEQREQGRWRKPPSGHAGERSNGRQALREFNGKHMVAMVFSAGLAS